MCVAYAYQNDLVFLYDDRCFFEHSISVNGSVGATHLYLGYGASEGNIYNVDLIRGYNDLKLYVNGQNDVLWMYSASGGGDLSFWPYYGDSYATGTKHFRIPHPDNPDKQWLQYVSVEAPEVTLKIRGVAMLNSGEATVKPPHHWDLATENYLTTVQLTPLGDCNGLYAPKASLGNTSFKVRELQGGTSDVEFMWELTATRKGYSDFNPEQTVEEEAKKAVDSMVNSPPATKEKYIEQENKRDKVRSDFKVLVDAKYKERTGRDFVDKVKGWADEVALEKQEAEKIDLRKEGKKELVSNYREILNSVVRG